MSYQVTHDLVKEIEYNPDLNGFIITLNDGRVTQSQFDLQEPYGGYPYKVCHLYTEHDECELSDEEEEILEEFLDTNEIVRDYKERLRYNKAQNFWYFSK